MAVASFQPTATDYRYLKRLRLAGVGCMSRGIRWKERAPGESFIDKDVSPHERDRDSTGRPKESGMFHLTP